MEQHIVLVTIYRNKMLTGDLGVYLRYVRWSYNLIRQSYEGFEIRLLSGVVSKNPDHILVGAHPNIASREINRRFKGRLLSKLFKEYPSIKKRHWGRCFWARGYFCATVGYMTEEMIKESLTHHFEPRQDDGFKLCRIGRVV